MQENASEAQKFNDLAKDWAANIPGRNYDIARHLIERLRIEKGSAVLDVACGSGILYTFLKDMELSRYTGVDISEKMADEFLHHYPGADVVCADFESEIKLKGCFDYIIIFNSIPHFNRLDSVFENARINLNPGGKFVIAHSKTREGLKEYHKNIGYICPKDHPIPEDAELSELCRKYGFGNIEAEDSGYFFFTCGRV